MATLDGLRDLLLAEPTLLPPAPDLPDAELGAAIQHRRWDEVHTCLRCGKPAAVAYVMKTRLGNRWLDMCPACDTLLWA